MVDDKDEKVVGKVNKIRRYHFFDKKVGYVMHGGVGWGFISFFIIVKKRGQTHRALEEITDRSF